MRMVVSLPYTCAPTCIIGVKLVFLELSNTVLIEILKLLLLRIHFSNSCNLSLGGP
jgi:hypothetical protein